MSNEIIKSKEKLIEIKLEMQKYLKAIEELKDKQKQIEYEIVYGTSYI